MGEGVGKYGGRVDKYEGRVTKWGQRHLAAYAHTALPPGAWPQKDFAQYTVTFDRRNSTKVYSGK